LLSNSIVSKRLFYLLFLLFPAHKSQCQNNKIIPVFGEGIITIGQFPFAPEDSIPQQPEVLAVKQGHYDFTYYIKGNKILRKDRPVDTVSHPATTETDYGDGVKLTVNLSAKMEHPSYLIDWKTKMTYSFFKKRGKEQISEKTLQDETMEWFYRLIDSSKTVVKSPEEKNSVFIAGKKCYKGLGIAKNGDDFEFYYTVAPLKARSPLDAFMSVDFPYEILSIKARIDWTGKDGQKTFGTLILQVLDIQECQLENTLFDIPANVPIRKNVPWQEIYGPEQ
jgi:hypothetical protein